jgi:hypothetical protein
MNLSLPQTTKTARGGARELPMPQPRIIVCWVQPPRHTHTRKRRGLEGGVRGLQQCCAAVQCLRTRWGCSLPEHTHTHTHTHRYPHAKHYRSGHIRNLVLGGQEPNQLGGGHVFLLAPSTCDSDRHMPSLRLPMLVPQICRDKRGRSSSINI